MATATATNAATITAAIATTGSSPPPPPTTMTSSPPRPRPGTATVAAAIAAAIAAAVTLTRAAAHRLRLPFAVIATSLSSSPCVSVLVTGFRVFKPQYHHHLVISRYQKKKRNLVKPILLSGDQLSQVWSLLSAFSKSKASAAVGDCSVDGGCSQSPRPATPADAPELLPDQRLTVPPGAAFSLTPVPRPPFPPLGMFCPLVPPWRGARTSPSRKCFPTLSLGREALLCSRGRSARLDEEAATPFDGLTAFLPAAPEGGSGY